MSTPPPAHVEIAPLLPAHWPSVQQIYAEGLATKLATFETGLPSWERWDATHLPPCRLVALAGEEVVAWAALSAVSARAVYAGVAEVSVYVATAARGNGVGTHLLCALVAHSERAGFWTLQAAIFAENGASVRLHHRCGFRTVGRRERLAQRDGIWHDVLVLERRSALIGL